LQKRLLTIYVDDDTVETLRRLAVRHGLVCKTGPGAPISRGNISELLIKLAREMAASPA
jgi:hypothetical protein